jgi:hypothetical protein
MRSHFRPTCNARRSALSEEAVHHFLELGSSRPDLVLFAPDVNKLAIYQYTGPFKCEVSTLSTDLCIFIAKSQISTRILEDLLAKVDVSFSRHLLTQPEICVSSEAKATTVRSMLTSFESLDIHMVDEKQLTQRQ